MRSALRYSTAVFTIAVAVALTTISPVLLAPMKLFFLWVAVLITAIVAGSGPGLLATVLALLSAIYLIFEPVGSMQIRTGLDLLRLILFAGFAGGLSIGVGRSHDLAARLRDSEQRYRTLVESTPVSQAVWTATPDGRIHWAPEWASITGQSAQELDEENGLAAVHPDDRARTGERWKKALETSTLYEDEIRVRMPSDRYRWFAIKASPVRGANGKVEEWVGIAADIDDRKRHEANAEFINKASDLLSSTLSSEEAMRNLARFCVPDIADWCAIHLGEGDRYRRIVVEHADPAKLALLSQIDAGTRPPPAHDAVAKVIQAGKPVLLDSSSELVRELMSPEQYAMSQRLGIRSWIIAPMVAHGRTVGTLTLSFAESGRRYTAEDIPFAEDLARRAAMTLDNARLYEAAEAANRAKDEFLATLSHELRTPLTAISGWAHMLETGIEDPATRALAIETIVRSAKAQGELIDDLLDLSRVVAGTLHLTVVTLDFAKIVEEVLVAARPAAEARGVTVDYVPPGNEGAVVVRGDDRRLRQIVWNLVTNAIKFTDRGGNVEVRVTAEEASARVQVKDTGRGIEPAFLPFVWDRFRQADSSTSRQYGGLGLGLAVVRHLTEMHGGTVHASSDGAGRGAVFSVTIPLAPEAAHGGLLSGVQQQSGAPLHGKRILLVDDDGDARAVLTAMLRQFGAEVSAAASVAEAMLLLDGGSWDAIVSDIAMPEEDGYSLVKRAGGRVPAVAVSAIGTGSGDRRRALAQGFADFVRKPVDPVELADAVRLAIRSDS